ncbi:MAG: MipA/OmpV family protein [Lentisphaeria bacterium]
MSKLIKIISGCTLIAATTQVALAQDAKNEKSCTDWKFTIGAAVVSGSNLYHDKSDRNDTGFYPSLTIEKCATYLRGSEIGWKFYRTNKVEFSVFTNLLGGPGLDGMPKRYSSDIIKADNMQYGYRGIDDRESQVEFGLRAKYNFTDTTRLIASAQAGERGAHGGVKLESDYCFMDGDLTVTPFVGLNVLGKDLVDYYFSVSNEEAADPQSYRINRSYDADDLGFALSYGVRAGYRINKNLSISATAKMQRLSDEISDSPIVRTNNTFTTMLGISYEF